jgi:hypothetical protein
LEQEDAYQSMLLKYKAEFKMITEDELTEAQNKRRYH